MQSELPTIYWKKCIKAIHELYTIRDREPIDDTDDYPDTSKETGPDNDGSGITAKCGVCGVEKTPLPYVALQIVPKFNGAICVSVLLNDVAWAGMRSNNTRIVPGLCSAACYNTAVELADVARMEWNAEQHLPPPLAESPRPSPPPPHVSVIPIRKAVDFLKHKHPSFPFAYPLGGKGTRHIRSNSPTPARFCPTSSIARDYRVRRVNRRDRRAKPVVAAK